LANSDQISAHYPGSAGITGQAGLESRLSWVRSFFNLPQMVAGRREVRLLPVEHQVPGKALLITELLSGAHYGSS